MKFRNYFPELNDNQLKMLEQKILEVVGEVEAKYNLESIHDSGVRTGLFEIRTHIRELFGESK